jgi:hypothetical protein
MFAEEIRRAAEAAPRVKLPEVSALLWKAFAAGSVTEAEAEVLSTLIEARKAPAASPTPTRRPVGSRPRTDASMERRRRWAASGRLPPAIAARFTLAECAVLAAVSAEAVHRGDCRLCIDHIAALVGVGRSTVKNAIRQARTLGLVTVRGTGSDSLAQPLERRACRLEGMDRLDATCRPRADQRGWGQIRDRHEYSRSRTAGKEASGTLKEAAKMAGSPSRQRLTRIRAGGGAGKSHAVSARGEY